MHQEINPYCGIAATSYHQHAAVSHEKVSPLLALGNWTNVEQEHSRLLVVES